MVFGLVATCVCVRSLCFGLVTTCVCDLRLVSFLACGASRRRRGGHLCVMSLTSELVPF